MTRANERAARADAKTAERASEAQLHDPNPTPSPNPSPNPNPNPSPNPPGSELLLLVPSLAGIVGSVVLPILGAVPDGAIMLFSGLGPDAQEQMQVGVGALAGSTIMLLTVPWGGCIFAGAMPIGKNGDATYSKKNIVASKNKVSGGRSRSRRGRRSRSSE